MGEASNPALVSQTERMGSREPGRWQGRRFPGGAVSRSLWLEQKGVFMSLDWTEELGDGTY